MADRIIKPDSGNDVVIQNNGGTRKIEVTNTGDVEVTGDFKATTVKATNLKANDGTASLEIADSSGDIGFSGNTDIKIKLPSAGGLYESDGSTEILTESGGAVSLKNTVLDSSVSMASSGKTLRNITQVALNSDQSLANSSDLTTFFSPTYTNLISGSEVQGAITILLLTDFPAHNARKKFVIEFSGSNITDTELQRNAGGSADINIGAYDYGGNGVQTLYTFTVFGPLMLTNAIATITASVRLANSSANSGDSWSVYGDNTTRETHFTWLEYK
jgi:hypothetical protein